MRLAIGAEIRLCITLHYLSSGANYKSTDFYYALGKMNVSVVIREVWELIVLIYMKVPETRHE